MKTTMCSLLVLLCSATAYSLPPHAQEGTLVYLQGGAEVGREKFNVAKGDSGRVVAASETKGKVVGDKMSQRSSLEIKPDGALKKYKRWITRNQRMFYTIIFPYQSKMRFSAESLEGGDKRVEDMEAPAGAAIVDRASYHLYAVIALQHDWSSGQAQVIEAIRADTLKRTTLTLSPGSDEQVQGKDGPLACKVLLVDEGGAVTRVYLDGKSRLVKVVSGDIEAVNSNL